MELTHQTGIWTFTLRMPCLAPAFFFITEGDGPESFMAQIPDPEIREIVLSTIHGHHVRIELDPVTERNPERLRVMIRRFKHPQPPPKDLREIVEKTERLARFLEARSAVS